MPNYYVMNATQLDAYHNLMQQTEAALVSAYSQNNTDMDTAALGRDLKVIADDHRDNLSDVFTEMQTPLEHMPEMSLIPAGFNIDVLEIVSGYIESLFKYTAGDKLSTDEIGLIIGSSASSASYFYIRQQRMRQFEDI